MKNIFITLGLSALFIIGLDSCSGCVKKTSKSVAEIGISAVEGVAEAVEEHSERLGLKATDAAGKVALGAGKSLDKQLDEHATTVASVVGRTTVQTVDGFTDGFNEEIKEHYDELPYSENFVSGVSLDYFAKHKSHAVVDAYFLIPEKGNYQSVFECIDNSGKIFATKNIDIDRTTDKENRKYTLISFALNAEEVGGFNNLKNVKITVTKKK